MSRTDCSAKGNGKGTSIGNGKRQDKDDGNGEEKEGTRYERPNLAAVPCRQRPQRAPERERERPQQLQQQIQQFARIDWLRGTVKDDKANAWWEQLFKIVPAFQQLASDSNLSSRNSRGNVVEACVGASFLAAHELAASRAPAASGATIPRFH